MLLIALIIDVLIYVSALWSHSDSLFTKKELPATMLVVLLVLFHVYFIYDLLAQRM